MDTCVYSFTGHYGSGKTEAAVNFAMKLKRQGRNTALIDLDIVNPFFRSADARELLETLGIRTEIPLYANTNVDVPASTGVMGALIRDEAYDVVLDVGGDDLGAKALGRYREDILSSKDLPSASRIYDEIEAASGMRCDALVGNTNLLEDTTPEIVLAGLPLLNQLAGQKHVSIAYHAVTEAAADALLKEHGELFREENIIRINRTVKRLF